MRTKLAMLAVLALAVSGCGTAAPERSGIDLVVQGLVPLTGGFHYEGWVVLDDEHHSTGPFNVAPDGVLVDLEDTMILDPFTADVDFADASAFFVTIERGERGERGEPRDEAARTPSDSRLLGGELVDGVAELTVTDEHAVGADLSGAGGVFILATPSGPGVNERSGVWFITLAGEPGLSLPELPDGWTYQGWVTIEGTPVSTGRFDDPAAPDDASPHSGDAYVPPVPGEDFLHDPPEGLTFPTDLRGERVFVTIEPEPDIGPEPFFLTLRAHKGPDDAFAHVEMVLTNRSAEFPTATATLLGVG
jgi:hypothetical protein